MATKKKMLQAAAGNAGGGGPLNVEDVFSTYLYEGTGAAMTITNGVNLEDNGGIVWTKPRTSSGESHRLIDAENSTILASDGTNGKLNGSLSVPEYYLTNEADGFNLVGNVSVVSGVDYASWTFRKAPKFFDVVTYTGTGSAQNIAHNLGTTVGWLLIKRTDSTGTWFSYHHGLSKAGDPQALILNETGAAFTANASLWNLTYPTSTHFTVGDNNSVNASGGTYVAYLFAHNDGDGEFGPDGDADIIKCGSYTGNGSTDGPEIDLGFEPQWVLLKAATTSGNWFLFDAMRGIPSGGDDSALFPDLSNAEVTNSDNIDLLADGFKIKTTSSSLNNSSHDYIYIAIRRGTKVPESGDEVFAQQLYYNASNPRYTSNFPVDMGILKDVTGSAGNVSSRLTQGKFNYLDTDAETTNSTLGVYDYQNGFSEFLNSTSVAWMWKRAPNYFDVVAYTGAGAGTTFNHNLGVAPEMIWVKNRSRANTNWSVYHKDLELNGVPSTAMDCALLLNLTSGIAGIYDFWGSSGPSDTQVTLGTNSLLHSFSGDTFIAYLFASLPGISKVGSYTGNGSSQTIDCGFSSGARFILIRRTDSTGDWYVWDTERGIVTGNDPYLELNTTDAEVTSTDWVDPDSSGFIVNGTTINASSAEYIFYAVA